MELPTSFCQWWLSAGKNRGKQDYQSDLSFSLTSSTIGGGLGFKFSEKLMINAGVGYTMYKDGTKTYPHYLQAADTNIDVTDTYYKSNLFLAIGLDFSF